MDWLNQTIAQLRELFLSMTPGARITSGLLLAVVVVSLGYLFTAQTSSAESYLMAGEDFSSAEIKAMEAAFGSAGLFNYEIEGPRIRVPSSQKNVYMAALVDGDAIPPSFGSYLQNALDAGGVLGESNEKREARLRVARQEELNLMLRHMDGVENASVLYDEKISRDLNRKHIITASVNIETTPGRPLDSQRAQKIRNVVSASIAGMKAEDVVVNDMGKDGGVFGGAGSAGDLNENPYYSIKQQHERWLEGEIHELLSYIPGVIVKANADLNDRLMYVEDRVQPDEKPVPQQTQASSSSHTQQSNAPANGGVVGARAQGPGVANQTQPASRTNETNEESTVENTSYLVGGVRTSSETAPLTPEKVRVSIAIPSDYFVNVWREQNPKTEGEDPADPPAADLDRIRETHVSDIKLAVANLLPDPPAGVDQLPLVSVTTFQSIARTPIPAPSVMDNAMAWTSRNGGSLTMVGMAIFGFLMLRSIVKRVPAVSTSEVDWAPETAVASADAEQPNVAASSGAETPKRPKRKLNKGPSLKDDLVDMVQEDPDAAAAILRNWISSAA